MPYRFNPFTGNFDETGSGGGSTSPGGSNTQLQYNNNGVFAGISTMTFDGTSVTLAGRLINSLNGALSTTGIAGVPVAVTGTWITTGGTAITTKPQVLIEPTGTSSSAWNPNGTGLGVNAASTFSGNLLDLQVNGTSVARMSATGSFTQICSGQSTTTYVLQNTHSNFDNSLFYGYTARASSAAFKLIDLRANNGGTQVFNVDGSGNTAWVDGANFVVGTTTGTKIGTATTQKLGFYNKTPVVQPAAVADATDAASVITQLNALLARMRDLGLIAT